MMDSTVTQSCTDEDEEILQRVLAYKFEGVDDSYMWEGADEKERRAMVKAIQERMARTRPCPTTGNTSCRQPRMKKNLLGKLKPL